MFLLIIPILTLNNFFHRHLTAVLSLFKSVITISFVFIVTFTQQIVCHASNAPDIVQLCSTS